MDFSCDASFPRDLALEDGRFPSCFLVLWVGLVTPVGATFFLPDIWFCMEAPAESAGVFGVTSLDLLDAVTSVPLLDLFPSLCFGFVGFGTLLDVGLRAGVFTALPFVTGVGVVFGVLVDLFPSRGLLAGVGALFSSGVVISSLRLLLCVTSTLLFDLDFPVVQLFGGVVSV